MNYEWVNSHSYLTASSCFPCLLPFRVWIWQGYSKTQESTKFLCLLKERKMLTSSLTVITPEVPTHLPRKSIPFRQQISLQFLQTKKKFLFLREIGVYIIYHTHQFLFHSFLSYSSS